MVQDSVKSLEPEARSASERKLVALCLCRLRLHCTGTVWSRIKSVTDRPPIYTSPAEPVRFWSCQQVQFWSCYESGLFLILYGSKAYRRSVDAWNRNLMPSKLQENGRSCIAQPSWTMYTSNFGEWLREIIYFRPEQYTCLKRLEKGPWGRKKARPEREKELRERTKDTRS